MHMSDGIVNAPTSLIFGVIAVAAIGLCAVKARNELDERTVPLAGLVAAFIFAVQMVNFPILPGVSGHLLGGALAAILVGPYTGALCIAIVLVVQSLLFADGGDHRVGHQHHQHGRRRRRCGLCDGRRALRDRSAAHARCAGAPALGVISFIAALVGTVCAAMAFVVEYAIGGAGATSLGDGGRLHVRHPCADRHRRGIDHRRHGDGRRAGPRPDLVYLLRDARAEVPA